MNATELFLSDGKSAGLFKCGICPLIHRGERGRIAAEKCCGPYACDICGAATPTYHTKCSTCRSIEEIAKEAARFEKADKVTDWTGPVFCEGIGYEDGYFRTVGELMDAILDGDGDDGIPVVKYCWACTSRPSCRLDYDRIIENASDDAHEDFEPAMLIGASELEAAIGVFNEANKDFQTWEPNYRLAVLLPEYSSQPEGVSP